MAETKIADVVIPTVYTDYAIERSIFHSSLYKSGIVVRDSSLDKNLDGGAKQFVNPFWQDIIDESNLDEVPSETVDVSTDNVTASDMTIRRQYRVKKWGSNDMSAVLAGEDPMSAIMGMVENFWYTAYQVNMFSTIKGVIADNIANDDGDMVKDMTGETGEDAYINSENVIDATFLLGDRFQEITAIAMNSVPYSTLVKNNLIDFEPDSVQNIGFGTYLGKSIIVDDKQTYTLETVGGVENTPVYWTILFKNGAFGFGESAKDYLMTEIARDADKGGGVDYFHTRKVFSLHPAGFDWLESDVAGQFPTNAELATVGNWDRAYSNVKNIGFVVLKTLG